MIRAHDPELCGYMEEELARQRRTTSSSSHPKTSSAKPLWRQWAAISPTNTQKATPGKRYYGGCECVDKVEEIFARDRVKKLFGAEHANVQPHSGAQANLTRLFCAS